MALTVPVTTSHSPDRNPVNPFELARYDFNVGGDPFTIVMASNGDIRVPEACEMETDTFEALGDDREEVEREFGPYSDSVFMFLHAAEKNPDLTDRSDLIGMGRFIPYIPGLGLKTFNDLGEIAAKTSDEATREVILGSVGLDAFMDEGDMPAKTVARKVEERFRDVYGCADLAQVVDVSTLAPDMRLPTAEKLAVIEGLLKGMSFYVTDLYRSDRATHLIQFTETRMHEYLKVLGHPMRELFDLPPINYDSFGNGTDANMVAVPSALVSSELDSVFFAKTPATKHMARVQESLTTLFSPTKP